MGHNTHIRNVLYEFWNISVFLKNVLKCITYKCLDLIKRVTQKYLIFIFFYRQPIKEPGEIEIFSNRFFGIIVKIGTQKRLQEKKNKKDRDAQKQKLEKSKIHKFAN